MKTFKYLVLFASLAMISFAACNSKEQKCDENDNSEMVAEVPVEKTVGVEQSHRRTLIIIKELRKSLPL